MLIVPSRICYEQLTDRIGNIGELSGYLELWEAAKAAVQRGLLAISVVEHDEDTDDPSVRRLKFEVQHWLVANKALIGCFVFMSFSRSVV